MNTDRRIVVFVLSSITLYLLISFFAIAFNFNEGFIKRINLIGDIVSSDSTAVSDKLQNDSIENNAPIVLAVTPEKKFDLYTRPDYITAFHKDTMQPSLAFFASKLHELKKGKKRKIRIAYFGDSMIEGDLLSKTLRELLQKEFGGAGVGFVPITSAASKFRQTVIDNYSAGWLDENFKNSPKNNRLFLSGHLFRGNNDWVEMSDRTVRDSATVLEKILFYGSADTVVSVKVNNNDILVEAKKPFNTALIGKDLSKSVRLSVANNNLPLYGISLESESGVIVDNFSFRGISGTEFASIDTTLLNSIAEANLYDLFIFQYGVNVLYRPNDVNFNWYARTLLPAVKKLRKSFANTDFLIVSTADRAFRYDDEYKSAIGIDSLIKIQATVAYQTGSCFYNQFASMGGHNSIVDWADRKPSLANKDYVHPNDRGAVILGHYFFDAIMKDYKKYTNNIK
ncbi:hypothetical protein LK994_07290 [Ferruginibacter lapsinanis]|uniref:hypothetical protein n=1 Tax=Ferruginibacter lapsinanis TaxID=563172 RepID=UPI001E52EC10|nr:hypothetical protein [Ferruginibacter lapsinanis]UEG51272.1 hypothetical protein LK994_07290 [Ferruginibacter lapsinanis]